MYNIQNIGVRADGQPVWSCVRKADPLAALRDDKMLEHRRVHPGANPFRGWGGVGSRF